MRREFQATLAQFLGEDAPALDLLGSLKLLSTPFVAVFASNKAPGQIILHSHDLAQSWRNCVVTVISGFHSSLEHEIWDVLWPDVVRNLGDTALVKVLARGMLKRVSSAERDAFGKKRLVFVSPFASSLHRASRQTAYQRNLVAAALAGNILILHAHRESSTFKLAQEVCGWGKTVYTLDAPANRPLLDMGLIPFDNSLLMHSEEVDNDLS